ncbi:MAG: hypothetical protein ACHREM_30185 [Polyangiales bacterium]
MFAFESRLFISSQRSRRLASTIAVAFSLRAAHAHAASTAHPAEAAVDPEVKKFFEQGNDLFRDGRYADALVAYDEAYRLSHNYKILYNRGQCLDLLRREPEAIETLSKYLADGGSEIPADRRQTVEADIVRLKALLGTIRVVGLPDGAEVLLDGRVVATTPLAGPIVAGMGVHELGARAPGATSTRETITVVAGKETTQALTINALSTAPMLTAPPAIPPGAAMSRGSTPPRDRGAAPHALPMRPAGGLPSPALTLGLELGLGAVSGHGELDSFAFGLGGLTAGYRFSPFWEFGLFVGTGSGSAGYTPVAATPAPSTASFTVREYGIGARMHLARGSWYDLSAEVELGGYSESWTLPTYTQQSSTSWLLKFGLGLDVPISSAFGLGIIARYHNTGTSYASGLTGGACNGVCSLDGTNGFFEAGIRVTWSIGFRSTNEPATPPPVAPTSVPTGGGSVATESSYDLARF